MLRLAVPVSWPAQQPQLPNDNLADRALASIAVVVLACLEPPFGTSLLSLGQELAADLCQPSPGNAPYPLDILSLLSVPVLEGLVDGQGEVRDSFAVTRISKL